MTSSVKQTESVAISVIIPTRNRLAFLKEAVASVSSQDFADCELVVVDDASEDGTWAWLSSLQDPKICIFRPAQHGERSAARNLGLRQARGKYVLFLDDDDLLAPGALSYLHAKAERYPKALAVVGARISFDAQGNWYRPTHPRWTVKSKAWEDVLFGWIPLQGQTLMRKRDLLAAGAWDDKWRVAEDHELWLRLASASSTIVLCPRVVCKMRNHPGQTPLVGRYREYVNLRRDFVSRLPSVLRCSGQQIFRVQRMAMIANKYQNRGRYWKSASYYLKTILFAPELLMSLQPRMLLLGGLSRSLAGVFLGKSVLLEIRKMKTFIRGRQIARVELPPTK
jgi:glycosyltransferase involved in cell wall biosynthesis